MSLIDDYIDLHHESMTVSAMAKRLGVPDHRVEEKLRRKLKVYTNYEPISISQDQTALLHFIEERKEGVWVDIAKQRLKDLQKQITQTT